MRGIVSRLCALLFFGQLAIAQMVLVNFVPTRPGYHQVPSGSMVTVLNNTGSDVTVQVPYDPPLVVPPGKTVTIFVEPNPGGLTYVEGPDGNWGFDPR